MNHISINIDKVIKKTFPDAIEKGLQKAGYLVENSAKVKCGVATGTLRKSIIHEVDDNTCCIGSNVEYAPYHHNNNPFLEDALSENYQEILECFKGVLDDAT